MAKCEREYAHTHMCVCSKNERKINTHLHISVFTLCMRSLLTQKHAHKIHRILTYREHI